MSDEASTSPLQTDPKAIYALLSPIKTLDDNGHKETEHN